MFYHTPAQNYFFLFFNAIDMFLAAVERMVVCPLQKCRSNLDGPVGGCGAYATSRELLCHCEH